MAEETIRIEGLRYDALSWEMRALAAEAEVARRKRSPADGSASSLVERWHAWCTAAAALLTGIYAAEEARALLERRYLDGHPALFPKGVEDWEQLRGNAEHLASLGDALPRLMEGRRRAPRSIEIEPPDLHLDALRSGARTTAPALAARLVDDARASTLDTLGETKGAAEMMARLRRAISLILPE